MPDPGREETHADWCGVGYVDTEKRPATEQDCTCESGRGTTCGKCVEKGHSQSTCTGRVATCAEWGVAPLEPQEVCPSCGHYALWHDVDGCGKCFESGRGTTDPVAALDAAYESEIRNHDRTRDYPAGREKPGRVASHPFDADPAASLPGVYCKCGLDVDVHADKGNATVRDGRYVLLTPSARTPSPGSDHA